MCKKDLTIHIQNVYFQYPGKSKHIFKDISVDFRPGQIYGLLGQNGAGKSTLFKLITGVLSPGKGCITTFGCTPSDLSPVMLSRLNIIPENIESPKVSMSKYARTYGLFYPNFSFSDLDSLLDRFDVDPDQHIRMMSLGQRKKAFISFAYACNTDLLLMDEPTNGLDIPSKRIFRDITYENQSPDKTIIISTHQVRDLEQLINAVVIVNNKKIILDTTIDKLLELYHIGQIDNDAEALYEEKNMHKRFGIVRRTPDMPKDESVDLELIFNAAVCDTGFGSADRQEE